MLMRLFIIFFLSCSIVSSQENYRNKKNNQQTDLYGKIYGSIKDLETKSPLEYTSVSLYKVKNSNQPISKEELINGTITNQKGGFSFEGLSVGNYLINVSYAGYITRSIECKITSKKLNTNLKSIFLETDKYLLQDVQIVTEAPIYENKIEKIVYNVQNDLEQSANDGIDVLRNAPLVTVDINNKVSLRGSENIKFLLNGKTSSFLHGDNVTDVLQALPAEQIKSIEVITSPGAKYDADGDAGIINIITDKKNIEGFNSSINTSTGTRVNRSSFNLNAGKNRFGVSASASARYGWPRDGNTTVENTIFDGDQNTISQQLKQGNFVGNWLGFRGSFDIYYDINSYNSVTMNINIGGHQKSNEGEESVSFNDFIEPEIFYLVTDTSLNNDTEYEYTVNYVKQYPNNPGQELVFSLQYGSHIHDDNKIIYQDGFEDNVIDNRMLGNGYELTGQIDYIHPFGDDNKLELGVKRIGRYTTNDYQTDFTTMINWLSLDALTNVFYYNQEVSAMYLSTNLNFDRDIGVLMGTRYERTDINGEYDSYYMSFDPVPYHNIVPNLTISKKLNMFQTIKLAYTNRIQRPDIHKVNTNIEISDLNNISTGNPELKPSNSHQLELGYTSFKPGLMTSFFLYYKKTYNVIETFTSIIEDDVFETNYLNTGDNQSYGFNFFGSTTIKKILTLRGGFDVYTLYESLLYKYNFNANVKLGKGYKLESRAFFRSPRQTIQGERPSFSMMSFGLKKDFSNKRGSIGIGIIEPFSKYKSFDTFITGDMEDGMMFENNRDYEILFRSVNLTFKYKFGKIDFDPIKKKAILENNDTTHDHDDDY